MKDAYADKRSNPLDRHLPGFFVGDWSVAVNDGQHPKRSS